jgi:hypothetical protein
MESKNTDVFFVEDCPSVSTNELSMDANCVEALEYASMGEQRLIASYVEGHHFVHTIVKSTSVSSVEDLPSVSTGEISTDANHVEALHYASMGKIRFIASHVEAKQYVSTGRSGLSVGYVKEVLSVLKNVQIMVDKRTAVQDVEVASSVRIVFLLLSVEDASSVHPACQFPFEAQEMWRSSLLLN